MPDPACSARTFSTSALSPRSVKMATAWAQDSRAPAARPTRLCAVPSEVRVAACLRRLPLARWQDSASCRQPSASPSRRSDR